jgi:hypothetical protein
MGTRRDDLEISTVRAAADHYTHQHEHGKVSWPPPLTGWNLQPNGTVNTTDRAGASESITDNDTNRFILVNPPTGNRFYRLFKP